MAVNNNIKEIRKKKNILQKDLANAIQCDSKTISRYETGKRCPSLELALRMARYMQISTDDLFNLDTDVPANIQGQLTDS